MPFNTNVKREQNIARLKRRAFDANRRAKATRDQARDAFYRTKDAAINALIRAGWAFVDSVDWSADDPIVGITFKDGGKLHTKLSALDLVAFRNVRHQLSSDPIKPGEMSCPPSYATTMRLGLDPTR